MQIGGQPHRADEIEAGALPGDFSATLECGGRRIGIVGLNSTFLQLAGGDYKRRLVWDARQLHAVCDGGVDVWSKQHDVCLLLTHQGPDWLTPEARKHGSEIAPARRFAAHLFGRQHETDITYVNLAELALDRKQWPEAEHLAREALILAEEVGRKELIASDCQRLAKALARQGRGDEGR